MKRCSKSLRLVCLAILLLNLSCDSQNQTNVANKIAASDTGINFVNETAKNAESSIKINPEGWELPDLTKCKLVEKRVKQKVNSPKPVFSNFYSPNVGQLLINTSFGKMRVLGIREFEIENRKFCYAITITSPSSKNPNISNVGTATTLVYYDLDGDGKFESKDSTSVIPIHFPKLINH